MVHRKAAQMARESATWIAAVLIVFATYLPVGAQQKSVELAVVENKLVSSFEEEFPTWTRKEVSPIEGSTDVAINQWRLDDNVVDITIIRYSSEDESLKRIRQFAQDMKAERNIPEEADEEYSFTNRKNSITLKKGNFIVNLHVNAMEVADGEHLLKQFAKLAIKAVKD